MASDPNREMIELVAHALGSLCQELVFVGGCATGLLLTDSARPPARATMDVDLIADVLTVTDYYQLQAKLRAKGFREDLEVSCRWILGSVKVDVMPTKEKFLGFSNRWYPLAVQQARSVTLPSGATILVVSPPLFLATKLEAFHGPGNGDYGVSHDMEDIVTLIDGRPELLDEIEAADIELREYLRQEVDDLIADPYFFESLPWHYPSDPANQERVAIARTRLRRIAGL